MSPQIEPLGYRSLWVKNTENWWRVSYTGPRDQSKLEGTCPPTWYHTINLKEKRNRAMKSTMYTMIIRDNIPEVLPISSYGTLQMPDGKLYWIVPVEQTTQPVPEKLARSSALEELSSKERVIKMLENGAGSLIEICRATGLSKWEVRAVIKDAGLTTPAEDYRTAIEEALLNAGEAGETPHNLAALAPQGQRLGPLVKSMLYRKTIRRLPNGNYAIA